MRLSRAIPALPVVDIAESVEFYVDRLGFAAVHTSDDLAVMVRDDVEIHLWASDDDRWRNRPELADRPVRTGAESFLAGTASCRIEVDHVDPLHAELGVAGVLHPTDRGSAADSGWGTREVSALDLAGNLLTFFERTG